MEIFPLPLFPDGALRESVVTTVWIGVFVISFFNLRFGWTYSGLVIPGYLVPLILTNPVTAVVTIAEGILAYSLVRFVSEYLSRFGWWCNFFGRDRFFALFIGAVLVRVTMDGWCLPALSSWLQLHWNLTFDYKGSFHSFGLIIIALIANQFWKTGLWRGITPFAATLGITFVIVRFVLMTVTNFNVGHMAYMYSNTAASLLASPKSYIILVVTGFVASRMNLRYGWEYNGILIPALLALQWYEPLKIVSSLCEAGVVYVVSDLLLQSRLFRGVTMEGARKLLLFFNVAYAYRFVLGHLLPAISPGIVVNDYYGFAYLLSSLIALKMHSKHIVLRLARATLQTSFVAAVAANLLGLWLASTLGSLSGADSRPETALAPLKTSAEPVELVTLREKVRLYRKHAPDSVQLPDPGELNRFEEALQLIRKHIETGDPNALVLARRYLDELRFAVELLENEHLCLREQEPSRGWGFYLVDLKRPSGLLVEVPAPLDEWSVVDAAVSLFRGLEGSTLAIAGGGRFVNRDGSADVLANRYTPFQAFHRVFGRRNVLQVRGDFAPRLAALKEAVSGAGTRNCLFVKRELPRSLSLRDLDQQIGPFEVVWKPAPTPNVQQRRTRAGFAELWLTRQSRIELKAGLGNSLRTSPGQISTLAPGPSFLIREWLLDQKRLIAKAGSNSYVPAAAEEMRFFDEEILKPLLEVAQTYKEGLPPEGARLLQAINTSAGMLNYQACVRRDESLNQDFLILTEAEQTLGRRYWGTFALRLGQSRPYAVQVPRPLFDLNSLECGVFLFERLQAESLLLAGSHNEANQPLQSVDRRGSDVLDFRNTANLFTLVNQVIMREAGLQAKMAVQCRGFARNPGVVGGPEILVAFQDGIRTRPMLTPLGRSVIDFLNEDGFRLEFVDGSPVSAGYEISCVPQAQYMAECSGKEFAIVWLSPTLREVFQPQDDDYPLQVQLKALDIPMTVGDLAGSLKGRVGSGAKTVIPPELKSVLDNYVRTMDIVSLQHAVKQWPEFCFSGLLDRGTRQLVLLISQDAASLPVVLNLRPRLTPMPAEKPADEKQRIELFLASRSTWLEWAL